jgi:hypothetical protein
MQWRIVSQGLVDQKAKKQRQYAYHGDTRCLKFLLSLEVPEKLGKGNLIDQFEKQPMGVWTL